MYLREPQRKEFPRRREALLAKDHGQCQPQREGHKSRNKHQVEVEEAVEKVEGGGLRAVQVGTVIRQNIVPWRLDLVIPWNTNMHASISIFLYKTWNIT